MRAFKVVMNAECVFLCDTKEEAIIMMLTKVLADLAEVIDDHSPVTTDAEVVQDILKDLDENSITVTVNEARPPISDKEFTP